MSAPNRAAGDEPAAAPGGAGGAPLPPAQRRPPPAEDDDAYERRLKLTGIIGSVALNGYAREALRCAGLCRETWRCIPVGLSAADADRGRRDHPLRQAIINLKHGKYKATRLDLDACAGRLSCVCELCVWRADIEAADKYGRTPLFNASQSGHPDVVCELLSRGANIEAAADRGATSLFVASHGGYLDVARELLARGANIEAAMIDGVTSLYRAKQTRRAPPDFRRTRFASRGGDSAPTSRVERKLQEELRIFFYGPISGPFFNRPMQPQRGELVTAKLLQGAQAVAGSSHTRTSPHARVAGSMQS
jgi:hypothetical protein